MRKSLITLAVLGAMSSSFAFAEDAAPAAETPTWTFPGSISLVSDYIWHGQSQTWGKPAVQAGVEIDHASGFYAGFWGSNVSSHWLPNANLETDWSLGYRGAFATDFKYDIGGTYVYYPNGNFDKAAIGIDKTTGVQKYTSSKLNTVELYASLNYKWVTLKGGVNPTKFYGWNTNNSGANAGNFGTGNANAGITDGGSTRGSGYVVASAAYDVVEGLTVAGEVGHQYIADSTGLDWTWYKLGVTKALPNGWSVNGFYTGTTGSDAYKGFSSFDVITDVKSVDKDKVVVGISKAF